MTQELQPQALLHRLQEVVPNCSSEEDLRVATEILLRQALPDLPVPKYEKSLHASTFLGRADALHRGLVIEYEKPRSLRSQAKRGQAIGQVCEYLEALAAPSRNPGSTRPRSSVNEDPREVEQRLAANVGVVTDGERIVFVQRRGGQWATDIQKIDEDAIEKLLLWLRATNRKDLSPENLITDFGPASPLAADVVGTLARLVASDKHPKATVIYEEWRRIFGIVYGTDQLQRTGKDPEAQSIVAAYHLKLGVDFPILLFAIHTYYALLMKLLATELIVAQGALGDSFIGGLARTRLRKQLAELESGEVLRQHNIRNAIEQDFFGWYPDAWTPELHDVLWQFAQVLAGYDIGTFQIRPDRARDLLKDLYHGLIPDTVRHALGEYYTPDWLAEHTVELAGYDGNPDKSFLDPACGSGTFLVAAIHKVRQWLTDRPVEWGSQKQKLEAVSLIRRNIVGFDLNPLAVIAARTNYLFALGPLLRYRSSGADFEIPVYLTDSVLLPGRSQPQESLFAQDTVPFPMTVGTFHLPREVVEAKQVPALMNLLHDAIAEGHNRDSFVARSLRELTLDDRETLQASLGSLFDAMKNLDRQGRNRIWAKLIRNRYAALFFRHYFDFVVGNPPHVNWESLTEDWRKAAEAEYRHYGLFTLSGLESRHGGGKKDIAALFTYAVMDHFVKPEGRLALVVHVSLFKTTGAGEGFRRFQLGDGEPFAVEEAHDFSSFQPFQTHSGMRIKTRTLTFRATKGKETCYPVPYVTWKKTARGIVPGGLDWAEACQRLTPVGITASPLRGTGPEGLTIPWLILSEADLARSQKVIAPPGYEPSYQGHAGAYTGGLNGAYFLQVLEHHEDGTILVRNLHDVGKILCPKVQMTIEADLVHPLLRGRSMGRWFAKSAGHILVLQDPKTQKGYPVEWLQQTHPLTWSYIRRFEKLLRARKAFQKFFDPKKDAFYSMYAVSEDTFARHKVLWMDISSTVKAAVLSTPPRGEVIVPEHTVMFVATRTAEEAHYLAAVLNSDIVGAVVSGYIVDNHLSTHPVENVRIPIFGPSDALHRRLVACSREAHEGCALSDLGRIQSAEALISQHADGLW